MKRAAKLPDDIYDWQSEALYLARAGRVFKRHGLLVFLVYGLYHLFRFISLRRIWFGISCSCCFSEFNQYDKKRKKAKPIWQDLYVVVLAALTVYIYGSDCLPEPLRVVGALYLLADIVAYYVEVLWLYNVPHSRSMGKNPGVWSFKRIGFQALAEYLLGILLFAELYSATMPDSVKPLAVSFQTATSLNWDLAASFDPHTLGGKVWMGQVLFSLFMLVGVMSALIAEVYQRREVRH